MWYGDGGKRPDTPMLRRLETVENVENKNRIKQKKSFLSSPIVVYGELWSSGIDLRIREKTVAINFSFEKLIEVLKFDTTNMFQQ